MISILYNTLLRIAKRRNTVILYLILTIGAILAAVFISGNTMSTARVAVQYLHTGNKLHPVSLDVVEVDKEPCKTDLMTQRYDAYVEVGKDIRVVTYHSDEQKEQIKTAFQHPNVRITKSEKRGTASIILGFMVMFVMMQSMCYMMLLQEDREEKILTRIATTPVKFTQYLMGQLLFALLFIFIPVMAMLTILSVFHVTIGMSLLNYGILTGLLSMFSISFALLIHASFYGDSANMIGSAIIVLTSILSGSFYSFEKGNVFLDAVAAILPQKAYLMVVEGVEKGATVSSYGIYLLYLLTVMFLFYMTAVWKLKESYRSE